MKTALKNFALESQPWFKTWFDTNWYQQLYANRNEREAAGFLQKLVAELELDSNSKVLDLGCGVGRHSKYLAGYGFNVTGFDLSVSSIREAKKLKSLKLRFLVHDMRINFGKEIFDAVFNLFTSFGYFNKEEENYQVIENMSTSLKPGGLLVLDYLNVKYSDEQLVPLEEREIDGIRYNITRWTDEKFFYKRIRIADGQLPVPIEYTEEVRRFRLEDFNQMFESNNFKKEAVYGDYRLNDYDENKSPRMIMLARKVSAT